MTEIDLIKKAGGLLKVKGKPNFRIELLRPITVRNKESGEKIEINECDLQNGEVSHLYVGRETEPLDPADFEMV